MTLRLIESSPGTIPLTLDQAEQLARIGRDFARDHASEMAPADAPESDDKTGRSKERSVIDVLPGSEPGQWDVTVREAIGLIAVRDLDLPIEVEPKIHLNHLLYLLEKADVIPMLQDTPTSAAEGSSFWKVLARGYITQLEEVLRKDLIRDYEHHEERLRVIRGRIDPPLSAVAYLRGRLDFDCEFEEFKTDTPLNRTLRAAASKVTSITELEPEVRRRGSAAIYRMEDVGDLRPTDLRATLSALSRSTSHYRNALLLARHLLTEVGRLPTWGSTASWPFLIRTPNHVETGIRAVLRERLGYEWRLEKGGTPDSTISLYPDLVVNGGIAVGDVKYKLFGTDWHRGDLYQSIAYAAAFHTEACCIIGFAPVGSAIPATARIGRFEITPLAWRYGHNVTPDEAASKLAADFDAWVTSKAQHSQPKVSSL